MSAQALFEQFLEILVEAIESGEQTGKWRRPWVTTRPQRFDGEVTYSGTNALFLSLYAMLAERAKKEEKCPYKIPRLITVWESLRTAPTFTQYYGTLKQWEAAGARVKQGSRQLTLLLASTNAKEKDDGTTEYYTYYKTFGVFNSAQVEGWQPPEATVVEADEEAKKRFDRLMSKHSVVVEEAERAAFNFVQDKLLMPNLEAFPNRNAYYATFVHEMVHWTGHKSRLDRGTFGVDHETYAFEELVAELGSAMLSMSLGFEVGDRNTQAYLTNWSKWLREDKTAGRRALRLARQAVEYLEKGGE